MKYEHSYGNFSIPAPDIADPLGSVEDATGELVVTHEVVSHLLGEIEQAIDLARRFKESPGSMDPEAPTNRLQALHTLASVVDQRLKDGIILLYAVIDNQSRPGEQEWLAAYMEAAGLRDRLRDMARQDVTADENFSPVLHAYQDAVRKVVWMRAPNASCVRSKLRLLQERWEGFEIPQDDLNQLVLDAEAIEAGL